ncbi:hypothetical protein KP509_32G018500 [Ceratopteris richardii]|uniref:Uncharacterized protein n=1 Tax=Ceratopteris richardii TaxID=49495 RepID=A0A8T2QSX7_CERRI|nr:hypothetical protein KP509_32G018500 [Ceratopteris richardii]
MKTCAHPYCDFKWFDKSNTPAQLPTLIQRAPRLSGYCSLSNFAGRHCRKYVITGSSKTKDEYKKGSIEYSMFLSPDEEEITGFSRSRGAKSSTRILNLTIDGIADYDTQRYILYPIDKHMKNPK